MGFDTSVLDAAIARRAAAWEEERRALLQELLALLGEMAQEFDLHRAYVFGSLARPGRYSDRSDVDVAVVDLPSLQLIPLAAALSSRLGIEVDLVELEKCPFADKIRREGLLWTR